MNNKMSSWVEYKKAEHDRLHSQLREEYSDYDQRIESMTRSGQNLGQTFPEAFPKSGEANDD
jgi:hypothetical protein